MIQISGLIFDIILKHHKKQKRATKTKSSTNVWGKAEDNKLRSIFKTKLSKRGINREDTTKKTLEKVIRKHLPGGYYQSFRQ